MRGEEISARATIPTIQALRPASQAQVAETPRAEAAAGKKEGDASASPSAVAEKDPGVDRVQLEEALASVKDRLAASRMLDFRIDDSTGVTVVKVLDEESGDLIRQLPPEQVMVAARVIAELTGEGDVSGSAGLLFSEQA